MTLTATSSSQIGVRPSSANETSAAKQKYSPSSYLWRLLNWIYFSFIRATYKWFLHVYTNKSEIERIMWRADLMCSTRIHRLEYSLRHSRRPELRTLCDSCPVEAVDSAMKIIVKVKCIGKRELGPIRSLLDTSLQQLAGRHSLQRLVEWQRRVQYDEANDTHEALLMRFWQLAKPDEALTARVSKQWQLVGFQGDNPSTDFRGMGLLGLQQLIYLFEHHADLANSIYSQSLHPKIGYPFAIAGISLTSLCRELLQGGYLDNHLYNTLGRAAQLEDFHDVYCQVFSLFSTVWRASNPESVMQFNVVRDRFVADLKSFLSRADAALTTLDAHEFQTTTTDANQ